MIELSNINFAVKSGMIGVDKYCRTVQGNN